MPREPIQIVTLSREYGAGGSQLGLLLGSALAWPVLDRDLAERLAKRLRCRSADVEQHHERAPRFLERIAAAFTVVPSDAPVLPELSRAPNPDILVEATRAVLLEAVRTPPLRWARRTARSARSDPPSRALAAGIERSCAKSASIARARVSSGLAGRNCWTMSAIRS